MLWNFVTGKYVYKIDLISFLFESIDDISSSDSTKMNEDNVNTIDAISQIKGKLTKYSQRKPDPEKVNRLLKSTLFILAHFKFLYS